MSFTATKTCVQSSSQSLSLTQAAKVSGIHELITRQAILRPGATATRDPDGRTWTYAELISAAAAVAEAVQAAVSSHASDRRADAAASDEEAGVGADSPVVAVALPRGSEMVAAMLGVMLSGATWVYLDPAYPVAHASHVLADSGACLVVSNQTQTQASPQAVPTLLLEDILPLSLQKQSLTDDATSTVRASAAASAVLHSSRSVASQLMCILYTSGSTGKPKGVALEHGAVLASMRLAPWEGVGPDDVFAQCCSAGFVGSMHDMWLPLLRGASVVFIPRDTLLDPHTFGAALASSGVTSAFLTPRVLELFADSAPEVLDGLQHVFVAGEAVRADAMAALARRPQAPQLWNLYGCTEHCGCISAYPVPRGAAAAAALAACPRVPIGRPTEGANVVILSPELIAVAAGETGELWVSGPQLARGYLHLPKTTAERFVCIDGKRFYRTGDLAVWRPAPGAAAPSTGASSDTTSMAIDLLGRAADVDTMVKVAGNRVELGAVEAAAVAASEGRVVAAVASLWAATRLSLYYVPAPGSEPVHGRQLRNAMAASLPPYMVPHYFTPISSVPLTANGKIDRAALPPPAGALGSLPFGGKADQGRSQQLQGVEADVARAMETTLGLAPGSVGAEDSFALDLGGTSLNLFILLPALRALAPAFGAIDMMPGEDSPAAIAKRIKQLQQDKQGQVLPPEVQLVSSSAPGEQLTPVFAIHGGLGSSPFGASFAAAMKGKRAVYVIELSDAALDAAKAHAEGFTVGLACYYTDLILQVQAAGTGSYIIAGEGRGALVAYEVGRELELRGQRVDCVVPMECFFRCQSSTIAGDIGLLDGEDYIRMAEVLAGSGRQPGVTDVQLAAAHGQLKEALSAQGITGHQAVAALLDFMRAVLAPTVAANCKRAMISLQPIVKYDCITDRPGVPLLKAPVVLARAVEDSALTALLRRNGYSGSDLRDYTWSQSTLAGCRIVDVPGNHMNMLLLPEGAKVMADVFASL